MSTHRISPQAGFAGNGSGVLKACRWCRGAITEKGRRTFCSEACVEQHLIRSSPVHVRRRVLERDHGVCATCGRDCEALREKILRWVGERWHDTSPDGPYGAGRREGLSGSDLMRRSRRVKLAQRFGVVLLDYDWGWSKTNVQSLWQADHVLPVCEGGGECGLDGYRTLCTCCHKAETRQLAARRAEARRLAKATPSQEIAGRLINRGGPIEAQETPK